MKMRFTTLAVVALAVLMLSSLAMAQPWGRGCGGTLAAIPPEKQEQVAKLFAEGRKTIYELESKKWDKQAELNILMAAPKPDSSKIDALAKEIGTLSAKAYQERVALQQRILKETGVNMPLSGGMGGAMGMGGGMGRGGCGMGGGMGRGYCGPGVQNSGDQTLPPCCQPGQSGQPAQPAQPAK